MLIQADARYIPLKAATVQCVVASPPYWGLRDYGVDGQIGLELSPVAYVATMVGVFREVWRVLKADGTVWLNLGDSYAAGKQGRDDGGRHSETFAGNPYHAEVAPKNRKAPDGLKPKDLIGIPWRVAFALQADGWYLRSDIIWNKPAPMPESVTDRPTRSHEYLFLLTKSERYFYDAGAIREPTGGEATPEEYERLKASTGEAWYQRRSNPFDGKKSGEKVGSGLTHPLGRNRRSVWTINSEPTPDAHFATFPQKLVEPCVLAGSRPSDVVLDPFIGSGTVGRVCERLGRRWVGLDLNATYLTIAKRKTAQMGLVL